VNEETTSPLEPVLKERIAAAGRLTFAEFMAACLYEPGLGYYTSAGRKVGAEGDFYTSSNVHAVFGRLIARELRQMWLTMGQPAGFQIVEAGAGGGRLAADIMDSLAELDPAFYQALTYRFIEAEPTLAAVQAKLLAGHAPRLAWSSPAELAAGTLSFTGCLLSNELIDALPVHLVEMTRDGLQEVFVTIRDGRFAEALDTPSTPAIAAYLDRLGVTLAVGKRAEVPLAAAAWLAGVARALTRGFVMTIDYGYLAPELYGPLRMGGTLLCYYRHTVAEDPYIRVGLQDITSHVDFTGLMKVGEEHDLATAWFGEQYRFLLAAGILQEAMALETRAKSEEERLKGVLALKKLMLPDGGMGDTFKVLIQAKGVAAPRLLAQREWGAAL
jgi:SAM-dependent MidA family methyltransferase